MFDSEFKTDSIYHCFSRREMMRAAVISAMDSRFQLCSASSATGCIQRRAMDMSHNYDAALQNEAWYFDTKDHLRKRFTIYKKIGVNLSPAEIDWAAAETEEGKWRTYRAGCFCPLSFWILDHAVKASRYPFFHDSQSE